MHFGSMFWVSLCFANYEESHSQCWVLSTYMEWRKSFLLTAEINRTLDFSISVYMLYKCKLFIFQKKATVSIFCWKQLLIVSLIQTHHLQCSQIQKSFLLLVQDSWRYLEPFFLKILKSFYIWMLKFHLTNRWNDSHPLQFCTLISKTL